MFTALMMTDDFHVTYHFTSHVMSWKASLLIMGLLGFFGLLFAAVVFFVAWHLSRKKGH